MLPTEQVKFIELVSETLAAYSKPPNAAEVESWWMSCRRFTLQDVQRALNDHTLHADDGKRAPRPIDVRRRLEFGAQEGQGGCAANGCAYPGIFSDSTAGSDRWWCPWHRVDRSGPEAERWAEISRNVPYATAMKKRVERMGAEASRSEAVISTAWSIAKRHGKKPWRPVDHVIAAPFNPHAATNEDAEDPRPQEVM